MVQHATVDKFGNTDLGLEPEVPFPDLSDGIQKTLPFLMAWYQSGGYWRRVSCDVDGRVYVSTGGVPTNIANYGQNNLISPAAPTPILSNNPNRRKYMFLNLGTFAVYLGFDLTLTANNGLPIQPGTGYEDDTYTGPVYLLSANGSGSVAFEEF